MKDIFISYKTEEFDEANWVKNILETNGISCWMAPASIPGGSSYAVEIPQAIRNAKVFVLILSSKAQDSQWVSRELDLALNEGKTVMPFMLENCDLKDDFNFYLTNVQRYAAYENKSKAMERMVKEIKALLGIVDIPQKESVDIKPEESADDNKPAAETVKKTVSQKVPAKSKNKPKLTKKITIIASILVLAVIVAVVCGIVFKDSVSNTVEIAGEQFSISEDYIYLNNVSLTAKDAEAFEKLENINAINISNSSIPVEVFKRIAILPKASLDIENCGLTDEHLNSTDFGKSVAYSISFSDNKDLTDLSSLSACNNRLSLLYFENCSVTDISFISSLTELVYLCADNNGIADISAISSLTKLEDISLSGNKITNIDALSTLSEIDTIDISNNQIKNLNGLSSSLRLQYLYASNNKIADISGISDTTLLKEIDLSNNATITDCSMLSKSAENITVFNFNNTKTNSNIAEVVKNCTKMKELYLDAAGLENLDFVSDLKELGTLSVADNNISSIDELKTIETLTVLNISKNKITTIEGLELDWDAQYTCLNLSNNNLSEIDISDMAITRLELYGNNITKLTTNGNTEFYNLSVDYNDGINFEDFTTMSLFPSIYIFNCPDDKKVKIQDYLFGAEFVTEKEYLEILAK